MRLHRLASLPMWLAACGLGLAAAVLGAQTPPGQAVFRGSTVLVPVDVRVLDNKGRPVTDLTAGDFTVFENGVRQEIKHFAVQPLTAAAPDATLPLRRIAGTDVIAPQNRRLILIVLGRGRLQGPTKGLDALVTFVRERLLPQDQVALMAWNRATDFTTDHEKVAAVLERFITRHPAIETEMAARYSGLAALYLGQEIPRFIQVMIDDVFKVPQAGTRAVLPGTATDKARDQAAAQANTLSEIEARAAAYRAFGIDQKLGDMMNDMTFGMQFDEYVALNRQTMQDVGNLYAGLDYLRFLEGEKHLIFVTEQGFYLPSANGDRDVAAIASDARVAIDTFQTGGVATTMVGGNGFPVMSPVAGFQLSALRTLSVNSGGQVSVSEKGTDAMDRIVRATEFGYVLGYAPADPKLDSKFRRIDVKVARKGVTLSFRHGYFARPAETFDPRKAIATTRMVGAANFGGDVPDLRLAVKVSDVKVGPTRTVMVETVVAADRIKFVKTARGALAAISQAVLCSDEYHTSVGELWRTVDVTVPLENLDEVRQNGLKLSISVPVTGRPVNVKVVVYDYGSDLLGTKLVTR
jgi:VWFA-related protein